MITDSYSLWEANEARLERELANRPVCAECGEHIQDERAFKDDDKWLCEDCYLGHLVYVEDYT